ncbi:MAG: HK97 family phage prohead protease [Pseudomonadota bacterium]
MAFATIEGLAAVFGEPDENGDVIRPGAFRATLIQRPASAVRMLYQHKADEPIGRWRRLRETERGLLAEGEISLDTERGREAWSLARFGALDGLSIGFRTRIARPAPGGRELLAVDLWEISMVTFPMAPGARLTRIGELEDAPVRAAASRLLRAVS